MTGRAKVQALGMQVAKVISLPTCDFCKQDPGGDLREAKYDGKTYAGPWGYMCEEHYQEHGVGLGLGIGQRLVLS